MPLQYGTTQTLEVHYHRYRCPHCGKTSSEKVPLTYPETRITHRAAAWVKGLMRWQMPVSTVQKITGIHWETIRRIHKQTMDEALVRRWLQTRDSGYRPTYLAVDEFAVHKGHSYATCVMDLESGDVLWVGKGRSEADFAKFFEESGLEWLRGVKAVAMDMNASFNKLVRRHMPWADIVYDRYHMQAQYGKDVLGVVRLQEARRHKAEAERLRRLAEDEEDSQERKHLVLQARAETRAYSAVKSARWTLLRKDASLTGNARDALEDILEKHRDIAVCHSMKEELSELFRIRGGGGKGYALQEWKRWFDSAEASGIPALAGFARRKRERIEGLANHARHGISTGKLEGFNNRIKVAKRIGYGYRDDDFFFTTIRYISIPDLGSLSPKKT